MSENLRVDRAAEFYSIESEFDKKLIEYRFRTLKPLLHGSSCLELGPGSGAMTSMLSKEFEALTVVEGSQTLVDELPDLANMEKICSLFENYETESKFDSIILEHVIEHVDNPTEIISKTKEWLAPDGKVFIGVPNANSVHRQVAVHMGLLKAVTDLNQRDIDFGHRRVYTQQTLFDVIRAGGLQPKHFHGVFFKPLANGQINAHWTEEMWEGFYELGKSYPDLCAEILYVCEAD